HLDADDAVGRDRFGEAVVDVGLQRAQGERAHANVDGAAHFSAAQAAADLHAHALGAGLHARLGAALDDAAEAHALLELLGDALGDEGGVQVGVLDLDNRDRDLAARHVLQLFGDAIDLGALGADDQARAGGL